MMRRANMGASIAGGRKSQRFGASSVIDPEPRKGIGAAASAARARADHRPSCHQRVDAVEFQLVADEGDEGDVELGAVEVALEVEQEDFEQRRAVVEGRAAAETRDAVEPLRSPRPTRTA